VNDFFIIGESNKIIEALNIAKKVALSDANVLIFGESGTGKELFARYIHKNSKRRDGRFVALNCAAIPNELLENELFGHKKGAFTDANDDYIGKFGYADGGIIFLDEVAELGLNLQAKLLRIIQFKEYEPIGSTALLKSDVRIVAATNKNIIELVKEGKFREDLYYRLNVVPIKIPPLKDRDNDINLLADYFLEIYSKKCSKKINGFTKSAKLLLNNYSWPGNVRELQNIIERSVVLCKNDYIESDDIGLNKSISDSGNDDFIKSLKEAVDDFKKEYIMNILEKNNWNQTKTAKVLDIQRTYLSRLIKELGIDKY